jgi:Ca-activated chloride channel family protein
MFWSKGKQNSNHSDQRILVLDRSTSMEAYDLRPNRLAAAKNAAAAYVEKLCDVSPESRVSVVSYGDSVSVTCDGLSVSEDYESIMKSIEKIRLSGSTDIGKALAKARELLKSGTAQSQVVLLTDGEHNGRTDPVEVARKLKKRSVKIDCVGIGGRPGNVNERLMKKIASRDENGQPCYHFIKDGFELVEHFRSLAGYLSRE